MRVRGNRFYKLSVTPMLLLGFLGCAQQIALGVIEANNFKPGFNIFSRDQDIREGRRAAAQTDQQLPLINDPEVLNYVKELGLRLASMAPNNYKYPWTFKVVNSSDINAFALPGGFVYVNRGTIEAAENEAQLAGVIAHEEGHVVMRHSTHQASEIVLTKFPLALLGGALGSSQLARMGIGFGFNSLLLRNSRGVEAQADQVGAYIAYHAGYNPHAMAEFFQTIEQRYAQRTLEFFSDHPNPDHRIERIDAEIPQLGPPRQWRQDTPEFHAVKERLLNIPAAPKPRMKSAASAGRGAPPASPSGRMKGYQGRGFTIHYPANWSVSGDQDNVVLAPKGAVWSDPQSGSVQAYGASISRSPSSANNLDDDTRQLLDSLRRSNPNLRVLRQNHLELSGRQALQTWFENDSPIRGEKESDELVTLELDGSMLTLIFIVPEPAFRSYKSTFESMLQSFLVG